MVKAKVTVSIEKNLLIKVDQLAKQLGLSRSGMVSYALKALLKRRNQQIINQINEVISDAPFDEEDEQILRIGHSHLRKRIQSDEW